MTIITVAEPMTVVVAWAGSAEAAQSRFTAIGWILDLWPRTASDG